MIICILIFRAVNNRITGGMCARAHITIVVTHLWQRKHLLVNLPAFAIVIILEIEL